MSATYRVMVFGKAGCDKCRVLNKRLDDTLQKPEWADFDKSYLDIETTDGLLVFCNAECINPSRIPAMLVTRRNEENGRYEPLVNPKMGKDDKVCGSSKLYTLLGLQTDYTSGNGVITPKMISAVLNEARAG